MIESIIEWSIRNRFLVILASLGLAIAGVRAMLTMPVDAIPDLSENQVIVFTDGMGGSPQEIEDQVTYPLSVNLQGLAGVKVVRASSEFNFSVITIIFNDDTDYYFARERVLEKLSIASTFLPPGVTPYLAPNATAVGQIFWYTVEGDGKDQGELRSIQDWFVRYQLNRVPGVAEVASVDGAPKEYPVDLDPNKLRAFGISLGQVDSAVARSNSSVGGRVIHQGNAEVTVPCLEKDAAFYPLVFGGRAPPPQEPTPDDPEPTWHQVAELPEPAVIITEHRGHARTCPDCGEVTRAAIPDHVAAHVIGPRLAATMSYLVGRHHLSRRGVREYVEDALGVPVSLGTVGAMERETAAAKHVDETGGKPAGAKRWLWAAATATVAFFVIHARRNGEGLKALLGEAIAGIVCSDRWGTFFAVGCCGGRTHSVATAKQDAASRNGC